MFVLCVKQRLRLFYMNLADTAVCVIIVIKPFGTNTRTICACCVKE